ncbi:MAG: hypothetical protein ACR2PG_20595 [Hyphomicrobiaceae bacterium]
MSVDANRMRLWVVAISSLMCIALAQSAAACGPQVRIVFAEASPDYFRFEFVSGPGLTIQLIELDLNSSDGLAYVDTGYGAAELRNDGDVKLKSVEGLTEGDRHGQLTFSGFVEGKNFTYLVDLDDRIGRDTDTDHLTFGEIQGGKASARLSAPDGRLQYIDGVFDETGVAILAPRACV